MANLGWYSVDDVHRYSHVPAFWIAHGGKGGFFVKSDIPSNYVEQHPDVQESSVTYKVFGSFINNTFGYSSQRKYAVMTIVLQACLGGTMMPHLYGENRILISAADNKSYTYTEWTSEMVHWTVLYQGRCWTLTVYDGFILSMGTQDNPQSLLHMYLEGDSAVAHDYSGDSDPLISYQGTYPDVSNIYL